MAAGIVSRSTFVTVLADDATDASLAAAQMASRHGIAVGVTPIHDKETTVTNPVTDVFGEPTHFTFVPGIGRVTTKDKSYEVRRYIADAIGAPEHHDFTTARYARAVDVLFDDDTSALLVSTTNAGFRGIEGWFVDADERRFSRSLGEVTEWEVVR
jgi:hypothetical protein